MLKQVLVNNIPLMVQRFYIEENKGRRVYIFETNQNFIEEFEKLKKYLDRNIEIITSKLQFNFILNNIFLDRDNTRLLLWESV